MNRFARNASKTKGTKSEFQVSIGKNKLQIRMFLQKIPEVTFNNAPFAQGFHCLIVFFQFFEHRFLFIP